MQPNPFAFIQSLNTPLLPGFKVISKTFARLCLVRMDCGVEFREADVVHPFDDVMAHIQSCSRATPKTQAWVSIA